MTNAQFLRGVESVCWELKAQEATNITKPCMHFAAIGDHAVDQVLDQLYWRFVLSCVMFLIVPPLIMQLSRLSIAANAFIWSVQRVE